MILINCARARFSPQIIFLNVLSGLTYSPKPKDIQLKIRNDKEEHHYVTSFV